MTAETVNIPHQAGQEREFSLLFVILPYRVYANEAKSSKTRSFTAMPYGVLSIASYLKKHSRRPLDIRIFDMNLYDRDEWHSALAQTLAQRTPDVVGLSLMFDISYRYVAEIAGAARKLSPETLILLGGAAATTSWEAIPREQPDIDAVCYAEGEAALLRLVNAPEPRAELARHPAWVTRHKLDQRVPPVADYLNDLDELIDIDYGLIEYWKYGMKEAFSPFSSYGDDHENRQFFIVTSRGCPFKCVFCAEPSFHGKNMRYASVDAVIAHVGQLVERYGMNVLTFYDDQLLLERDRAKELFRRLAPFGLRVETPNGLTAAFIDDEMAMLMKGAGMDTVPLAIESGSDHVLKHIIHKPLRLDKLKGIVDTLKKRGLFVQGFFVSGLPGELEEHRDETVRFIKEVGLDWGSFSLATPLRGTQLYHLCVENGWIDKNLGIGDIDLNQYIIRVPGTDPDHIMRKTYLMNLEVNFVYNHRMSAGDYAVAARCFEDVIQRYGNHAFAYYYLAQAQRAMAADDGGDALEHYFHIVETDPTWKSYAQAFDLPVH
ncbi:Radical SAM superfamily enzyme YgiQ, UPF0313 family [Methylomagnum ishizawai]|uniref:Radical SAM superfamily enzyme YgiQ, UPF0313 family n=1 Tax=Methylomagnum ishizawai TaxID=1760988 RepID=A0A1Y6D1E9_9GAMM|nr:radical SAM protein [Methylomagnum ishizawai]SMF96416.1 Radical SAM superfamily enzyme YgiQ, UPF0313 family [Methylomagnum ishizawai]